MTGPKLSLEKNSGLLLLIMYLKDVLEIWLDWRLPRLNESPSGISSTPADLQAPHGIKPLHSLSTD